MAPESAVHVGEIVVQGAGASEMQERRTAARPARVSAATILVLIVRLTEAAGIADIGWAGGGEATEKRLHVGIAIENLLHADRGRVQQAAVGQQRERDGEENRHGGEEGRGGAVDHTAAAADHRHVCRTARSTSTSTATLKDLGEKQNEEYGCPPDAASKSFHINKLPL